ncbi:hypothetical protein ABZ070_32945 [Streptomyces sp. NPDC006283]|uniref:hypothetical protein n=1 Tax=Streptomyces sp. NPDC006283 TaxID=3156741 RepID=UPI0033A7B8D7
MSWSRDVEGAAPLVEPATRFARASPLNDLNDEQIQKLLGEIAPKVKELMEGVTLAIDYYKEGGYGRQPWNRICDGLAHEAMNLTMALSATAHLYLARDCERAVREATGITPREGGMCEALQQQVDKDLLMSVLTVGRRTMVASPTSGRTSSRPRCSARCAARSRSRPTRPWRPA